MNTHQHASARAEPNAKRVLTDRFLQSLKPSAERRRIIWDGALRNFGVKVGKGAVSFLVVRRNAKTRQLVWKSLGRYPDVSLAQAREAAGHALRELAEGRHPDDAKAKQERAEAEARGNTFGKAVDDFVAELEARKLRTWRVTEMGLRREFVDGPKAPLWRDKPITEITRAMVVARLDEIKRARGLHACRHALGAIRRLFNWAVEGERFGLTTSPVERIRDRTVGIRGNDLRRSRVLTDDELRDLWQVLDETPYPHGPMIKLLALTGQRVNDIAEARWNELDLETGLLTIPPERYKTGAAQIVPLAPIAVEILKSVPRFANSPFVFTTSGVRPMTTLYVHKRLIEAAIAKRRKKDGREPMKPFVLHDVRRSVRTRLVSDLGVDAFVAERVIGHSLVGLDKVYDQGSHLQLKRAALTKWADALVKIVNPQPPAQPAQVVQLAERRSK